MTGPREDSRKDPPWATAIIIALCVAVAAFGLLLFGFPSPGP